ncbi:ATP-dependent DNA helicase RecG [Helcococcus ovis]|uniref:ATP-dependent DNA helicase RecG n=3 Tax=Helcococcus ovis TaxID=72026 RepID=UPI0038B9B3E1
MKLKDIKGIGPKKIQYLHEMNIYNVDDLINYLPRKYEDRSRLVEVVNLTDEMKSYCELTIDKINKTYFYGNRKSISSVEGYDRTGRVKVIWYNDRFSIKALKFNQKYKFFGYYDSQKKALINPIISNIEDDRIGGITPIYSLLKGISQKDFIKYKDFVFKSDYFVNDYLKDLELSKYNLISLVDTLRYLHKPISNLNLYKAMYSYNLRNIFLDKLSNKMYFEKQFDKFVKFKDIDLKLIFESLNFDLTNSQKNAINQIKENMISEKRMNRIVIGDVGSGKTIVAVISAIIAIKSGYQVAFMAPTELLARQHYENYKNFFEKQKIDSALLTGSFTYLQKKEIYNELINNNIKIIFGTHSLFQEKVKFNNLGLVIMDEQQRFGVYQRKMLSDKGYYPDMLLLSATPIPRTMALSLYNNLDISYIDELPKNRLPIKSYLTTVYQEMKFMDFAYRQILEGKQVYVVVSRVEDEDDELESVERLYKKLNKYFNNKVKINILHGKMSVEEKNINQSKFLNKEIDILIATSIIEVGIDVPNANTIIIYDANQFGLSQLHQMRGRVGRSNIQSYCFFVIRDKKYLTEKLEFIANNNDGFSIANKDLEIRGSGDIYGQNQSGFIDLDNSFYFNEELIKNAEKMIEDMEKIGDDLENIIDNKIKNLEKVILN